MTVTEQNEINAKLDWVESRFAHTGITVFADWKELRKMVNFQRYPMGDDTLLSNTSSVRWEKLVSMYDFAQRFLLDDVAAILKTEIVRRLNKLDAAAARPNDLRCLPDDLSEHLSEQKLVECEKSIDNLAQIDFGGWSMGCGAARPMSGCSGSGCSKDDVSGQLARLCEATKPFIPDEALDEVKQLANRMDKNCEIVGCLRHEHIDAEKVLLVQHANFVGLLHRAAEMLGEISDEGFVGSEMRLNADALSKQILDEISLEPRAARPTSLDMPVSFQKKLNEKMTKKRGRPTKK